VNRDPQMTQISADKGNAMEVVPLICPKCGADLDVPDGVEVFRCQYCGSKCQVKASGSVRGLALLEAGVQKVALHAERAANGIDELVAAQRAEQQARDKSYAAQRAQQQAWQQARQAAHTAWRARLDELNSCVELSVKAYKKAQSLGVRLFVGFIFLGGYWGGVGRTDLCSS